MFDLALALTLAAAPTQLDLVWNISPSPHGNYAACGTNSTVCVVPGEWWAVCRAEPSGATTKTLVAGTLTIRDEHAEFSGCPFYELLIAQSVKLGGDASKAKFAAPGCERANGKSTVGLAPMDGKTLAFKSNADGSLQFKELAEVVTSCEAASALKWPEPLAIAWSGPPLSLEPMWGVEVVGDLNQDGAIEVVLFKKSTRGNDYVAMLGSIRGTSFERLAMTVTTPKLALTPEEKEVQAVQDAYDTCEHWSGEEGTDARRAAEIAKGVKTTCAAFKSKLSAARRKYPNNATLEALAKP